MGCQSEKNTQEKIYVKDDKANPKIFEGQNKKKEEENKILTHERINPKKNEISQRKILDKHPSIPINLLFETQKSLCKIVLEDHERQYYGTGFFMKVNDSKKYLITAYHVIPQDRTYEEIKLEIYNNKRIILKLKDRFIKYFEEKDITLIEIKDTDAIGNEIKFLYYDLNYVLGYNIYKNGYIFTIGYTRGGEVAYSSGQIVNIRGYNFYHNLEAYAGSGGSPIILLNNNTNEIRVIGIHLGADKNKKLKFGTFIAEILDENLEKIKSPDKNDKCVIQFISTNQLVNVLITCKITDNFSLLEEKLYVDFPELKNKNIYFFANGNIINRTASLKENNIKNDTSIIINEIENDD
jgi:hypothetical protein